MGSSCTTKQSASDKNNLGSKQSSQTNKNIINQFPKGKFYYNLTESKPINDNLSKKNWAGGYQPIYFFLKMTNILYPSSSFKIDLYLCNEKRLGNYTNLGQTEKASGSNIVFQKFFLLDYIFEREQPLRIIITCVENQSLKFVIETSVANVMGTRNLSTKYDVKNQSDQVGLELHVEAKNAKESQELARLRTESQFDSQNIPALFKANNVCFYVLSNLTDGKNYRRIYKSEEVPVNLAVFDEMQIEKALLFDSEADPIKIEFYDGSGVLFSQANTTVSEIKAKRPLTLLDPKQQKQIGYTNLQLNLEMRKSFIDYLSDGMQINLVIGIDFTASNGSPNDPNSLHYCSSAEPNFYERAIVSCGNILNYYDYDKMYPVFGFGAQMMGSNVVNHCFNLNFEQIPNISGIDNVIKTYKENLFQLNFSGPTYFTPLLRNVIEVVRYNMANSPNEMTYYILLILTDGQINDMTQTIDAVVEAANLPISIIIVGVGNANFQNMVLLDGDENPIVSSQGLRIKRDIVQFVEFRKYEGDATNLASEVLREVPRQVEQYYRTKAN